MHRNPLNPGPLFFLLLAVAAGCKSTPRVTEAAGQLPPLSSGYALLYELVGKQSGIGQALILGGGMNEKTKTLIREIAQTSKQATETIKAFGESDPALRLGDTGLPFVEQKSREAEESQTTSRLLFAGKKFEFRLLISQTKSMPYGAQLARELAAIEPSAERKKWLESFAKQYEAYRDRAEERLTVRGDE